MTTLCNTQYADGVAKRDELIDFLPSVTYIGECKRWGGTYRELHSTRRDEMQRESGGGLVFVFPFPIVQ